MPLVSVITPAYNVERYLALTARSALRQTHRNLELIIVDDGSTDRTRAIAEEIRRGDPERVCVAVRENGGVASARNTAIAVARGEFLVLLDGDDLWDPTFVERQLEMFSAHPDVDLVTGNGRFLGGPRHGKLVRPHPDPRPPISLATIISDEEAVYVMTMFRRRVVDAIGGFDDTLRTNEDFDFWFRAALAGFGFARNSEPLTWYRRRDDALSTDAVRMLTGARRVCAKMRPHLGDRPELALLDKQIRYYETELHAAQARHALAVGDSSGAAAAFTALLELRPSLRVGVAALLARHAGPLLGMLYQMKCAFNGLTGPSGAWAAEERR
jgi:glycosyltransferase involved in cell wall biosynthesis